MHSASNPPSFSSAAARKFAAETRQTTESRRELARRLFGAIRGLRPMAKRDKDDSGSTFGYGIILFLNVRTADSYVR